MRESFNTFALLTQDSPIQFLVMLVCLHHPQYEFHLFIYMYNSIVLDEWCILFPANSPTAFAFASWVKETIPGSHERVRRKSPGDSHLASHTRGVRSFDLKLHKDTEFSSSPQVATKPMPPLNPNGYWLMNWVLIWWGCLKIGATFPRICCFSIMLPNKSQLRAYTIFSNTDRRRFHPEWNPEPKAVQSAIHSTETA